MYSRIALAIPVSTFIAAGSKRFNHPDTDTSQHGVKSAVVRLGLSYVRTVGYRLHTDNDGCYSLVAMYS